MAFSAAAGRRQAAAGAGFRPRSSPAFPLARRAVALRAIPVTDTELATDSYCCLGLAHCFQRNDDGKLEDAYIIEPLSASSLECMATGAHTSFRMATGVRFRDARARDKALLPEPFAGGLFCDNFDARLTHAARTWTRPHAQDNLMDIVPLGRVRDNFNFSLTHKRILNMDNVVTDADNVKQDMSIDVYGREKDEKEDPAAAKAAAAAAAAAAPCDAMAAQQAAEEKEAEEEDALDALLAG